MLMRFLMVSLSALFLVSCQLHVNVSGLEDELVLIENETGEMITLENNELVSFDHNFKAFSAYDVQIYSHSGQSCHLVYKSGRFTTGYTELEVNCQPISSGCATDTQAICARVDNDMSCEGCLPQKYQTFANKCEADTSGLNPIYIGLDECQLIDNIASTNDTPSIFVEQTVTKDARITVVAHEFNEDLLTVTLEHDGFCSSKIYTLSVNKFVADAPSVDWAIGYSREHCEGVEISEQVITFDLKPIKDWYSQVNGMRIGAIELEGIGSYEFD